MLSSVAMIVLCVVGSCGLRLEEIGGQPRSKEINEGSLLEKAKGSILEKVKAAVKKEELGVEARSGEEVGGAGVGGVGNGGESPGGKGGDGKDKEVGGRGDERRKKKKRNCRGKTKGIAFKVFCNLSAEDFRKMLAEIRIYIHY